MASKIPGWTCAKLTVILNWIIFIIFTLRAMDFISPGKNSQMNITHGILIAVWVIMLSMNILLTIGVIQADASILQGWIKFNMTILVSLAIALTCIKTELYQDVPGLLANHVGLVVLVGVSLFAIIYFRTGIIEGESDDDTSQGTNSNSDEPRDIIV